MVRGPSLSSVRLVLASKLLLDILETMSFKNCGEKIHTLLIDPLIENNNYQNMTIKYRNCTWRLYFKMLLWNINTQNQKHEYIIIVLPIIRTDELVPHYAKGIFCCLPV